MKRFSLMIAAIMLLVGFTQCKKDNETPTSDQGVRITLTAGYGQNGGKTGFTPGDGSFVWTNGATEYINVGGSKSGYLGQLTGTGDGTATIEFSGSLSKTPTGETLYFFYLGNGNHAGVTTIDFSNQDGTLAHVTNNHIAISDGVAYTGQETFSATLNMKMAIAYFNTSSFSGEDVFLHGDDVYKTVGVRYSQGAIALADKGYVNIGNAGNGVYVALIPSTESETTLKFESNNKQGSEITFHYGIKPGYYYSNNGEALAISSPADVTDDVIKGLFTVSKNKGVRFAKGNLQYARESTDVAWSTGSYSFLTNQYDVVETTNVSGDYASQTAIGLFGWGTGDNPSTTSSTIDDYSTFTDWGSSVAIGGYTWYTLSATEWNYLLNTRSASPINGTQNARFVRANVHTKNGIVLFPDSFSYPTESGFPVPAAGNINKTGWSNVYLSYSDENWVIMEQQGAVFLPFTGYRNKTALTNNTSAGYYSSSEINTGDNCKHLIINNTGIIATSTSDANRSYGRAVRLVRDVE